eukprot:TRINITY_DN2846_c0_g1_i2.p2 TRINITY_DN2846_c0_g1~~TRINITY_DN2846_c0_g1_i2.p2  ORF type:complete len:129 (+),score=30.95 TRINITY_DN2846_c0_g1_i2:324-710(+)
MLLTLWALVAVVAAAQPRRQSENDVVTAVAALAVVELCCTCNMTELVVHALAAAVDAVPAVEQSHMCSFAALVGGTPAVAVAAEGALGHNMAVLLVDTLAAAIPAVDTPAVALAALGHYMAALLVDSF